MAPSMWVGGYVGTAADAGCVGPRGVYDLRITKRSQINACHDVFFFAAASAGLCLAATGKWIAVATPLSGASGRPRIRCA